MDVSSAIEWVRPVLPVLLDDPSVEPDARVPALDGLSVSAVCHYANEYLG